MTLIESAAAYDAFYPYSKGGYKPTVYPKHYPCLCDWEHCDGGLMGDYRKVTVLYLPHSFKHLTLREAFIAGVNAKRETLWSG